MYEFKTTQFFPPKRMHFCWILYHLADWTVQTGKVHPFKGKKLNIFIFRETLLQLWMGMEEFLESLGYTLLVSMFTGQYARVEIDIHR